MQDLYATHFEIASGDLDASFDVVAGELSSWAWRGEGEPPSLIDAARGARNAAPYRLTWTLLSDPDRPERALELELRHPDDKASGIEWRCLAELSRGTDYLRLSLRIAREATKFILAPATLQLRRPNLIPDLLEGFGCTSGGVTLSRSPRILPVDEVQGFISDVLHSEQRALPVIVVSTASGSERPEVDVDHLADEVAGLAHVVSLGGYLAWERFRDFTGAYDYVPPGGARLYWPGFGDDQDSLRHPYWTRRRLAMDPASFGGHVFRKLSRLSVGRVPRDPLVRDLQKRASERRLEAAREAEDNRSLLEAYEEMAKEHDAEVERLESDKDGLHLAIDELSKRIEQLEDEVELQRRQWAVYNAHDDVRSEEDHGQGIESWDEFAELLPALETDAFVLTDRARAQCGPANDYEDSARMWNHLESLAKAAEAYGDQDGAIGDRLNAWTMEHFGIEIALFDKELGQKEFQFEGSAYSREPHVKIDDHKSPAKCGRIYFAIDPERKRFIVDHVGLHL